MVSWMTRERDQADWQRIARTVHVFREAKVAAQWAEGGERRIFRVHLTRSADGAQVALDGALLAGPIGPTLATVTETVIWTPVDEQDAPAQWQHLHTTAEALLAQATRRAVVG